MRQRPAILAAFAGMSLIVILVFLMWVQLGFGLTFAKIAAFTLVALVAARADSSSEAETTAGAGLKNAVLLAAPDG